MARQISLGLRWLVKGNRMTIRKRRCERCSQYFRPKKDYYRLCNYCFADTRPIGSTKSHRRPGGADRRHGGQSQLIDSTHKRSLILRGELGGQRIIDGFRDFATDYYGQPGSLGRILLESGVDSADLQILSQDRSLNSLLMKFCPNFRLWIITYAGDKAAELLIEYYGLYGDDKQSLRTLGYNLGIRDPSAYKAWAVKKLRARVAYYDLKRIALKAAKETLK